MAHETTIHDWLRLAVERSASDLHIVVGHPPILRIHGELHALDLEAVTDEAAERLLLPMCDDHTRRQFDESRNVDFAYQFEIEGTQHRFRTNFFWNGDCMGACFRLIPVSIPELQWAGFSQSLAEELTSFRNGLVLISGVTGAGKTTTLAMLIQMLNRRGGCRIITVEEPIEYIYPRSVNSIITQREVGRDVQSFADGLKYGLRQDPDVLLVGEIRDRETAQLAMSAAETGHLVFSTLHTRDAKGAVSRIADLFPDNAQSDIRSQLSMSLRAVVSQHLVPGIDSGQKRELAMEIMIANSAIRSGIRFGKFDSIDNNIQTGRADGMMSLDSSIKGLLAEGRITRTTAEHYVSDPAVLDW